MPDKRIVMKQGFYVDDEYEAKKCHYREIETDGLFGSSDNYLIVIDNKFRIKSKLGNVIFDDIEMANNKAKKNKKRHLDWCNNQIEYYKNQIVKYK